MESEGVWFVVVVLLVLGRTIVNRPEVTLREHRVLDQVALPEQQLVYGLAAGGGSVGREKRGGNRRL